jgi:hypothetical protein
MKPAFDGANCASLIDIPEESFVPVRDELALIGVIPDGRRWVSRLDMPDEVKAPPSLAQVPSRSFKSFFRYSFMHRSSLLFARPTERSTVG